MGQLDNESSRLPGTAALSLEGDVAAQMIAGIHRYLDRELDAADGEAETALRRKRIQPIPWRKPLLRNDRNSDV